MKATGIILYSKVRPEVSLEQINEIADYNERTNHLLKTIMCQYIRKNEPLTEEELQTKPEVVSKRSSILSLGDLNENERVILEAARELNYRGEQISQERLYSEVCSKISDYTEFAEAAEDLSCKGYLNVIQ